MAVLEHNGKLSVLPKASARPLTPRDMSIGVPTASIGTEIIMDGRIMGDNLTRIGRRADWLMEKINAQGFADEKDILLAIYHSDTDNLTIYEVGD